MPRRTLAIALTIGLVASGCTSRTPPKVGLGIGLGLLAVSGLVAVGAAGPGGETDPEVFAPAIAVLGILVTFASLVALGLTPTSPTVSNASPPASDPAAAARAAALERALELTKQAAAAARAGDCALAVQHDPTVKQLDAEFHATVFAHDAEIARCLAPAPPAEPLAPPVEPAASPAPSRPAP